MLLKFREIHVIKFLLVLFLTFCFINVYPQSDQENSLKKQSAEILDRNISFQWAGGTLPELLKELSEKEKLNFSYSREKTKDIIVENHIFQSENISTLLNRVLQNTGYTFIVIGKTIAIVKAKIEPLNDTLQVIDSVSVSDTLEKAVIKQKDISHIYPESPMANFLPYSVRKELRKIYRYELSLARKQNKDSTTKESDSDNLAKQKTVMSRMLKSGLFVSANVGLSFTRIRHSSDFPDWKNFLEYKSKSRNSICIDLASGIALKSFIIETGFRYYKMKFDISYIENPKTMKMVEFSENYTLFTVPANLLYYKNIDNWIFGGGPGLGLTFIRRTAPKNKMKPYYDRIKGPGRGKERYSESNRNSAIGINLKVFAAYEITKQWLVSANVQLNIPLNPYHSNSLYSTYPYAVFTQLSISYFLFKRIN